MAEFPRKRHDCGDSRTYVGKLRRDFFWLESLRGNAWVRAIRQSTTKYETRSFFSLSENYYIPFPQFMCIVRNSTAFHHQHGESIGKLPSCPFLKVPLYRTYMGVKRRKFFSLFRLPAWQVKGNRLMMPSRRRRRRRRLSSGASLNSILLLLLPLLFFTTSSVSPLLLSSLNRKSSPFLLPSPRCK